MNNRNTIGPNIDIRGTQALTVINLERQLPFGTACIGFKPLERRVT